MKRGLGVLGVCTGVLVYEIWNICDAVKVAKVKNMYYSDFQRRSMEMGLYPSLDYAMTANGITPVAGMKLSVQF